MFFGGSHPNTAGTEHRLGNCAPSSKMSSQRSFPHGCSHEPTWQMYDLPAARIPTKWVLDRLPTESLTNGTGGAATWFAPPANRDSALTAADWRFLFDVKGLDPHVITDQEHSLLYYAIPKAASAADGDGGALAPSPLFEVLLEMATPQGPTTSAAAASDNSTVANRRRRYMPELFSTATYPNIIADVLTRIDLSATTLHKILSTLLAGIGEEQLHAMFAALATTSKSPLKYLLQRWSFSFYFSVAGGISRSYYYGILDADTEHKSVINDINDERPSYQRAHHRQAGTFVPFSLEAIRMMLVIIAFAKKRTSSGAAGTLADSPALALLLKDAVAEVEDLKNSSCPSDSEMDLFAFYGDAAKHLTTGMIDAAFAEGTVFNIAPIASMGAVNAGAITSSQGLVFGNFEFVGCQVREPNQKEAAAEGVKRWGDLVQHLLGLVQ